MSVICNSGGCPDPVVKKLKRKDTTPVKHVSIEERLRMEQKKTELSFSKAYFARYSIFEFSK